MRPRATSVELTNVDGLALLESSQIATFEQYSDVITVSYTSDED